MKHIEYLFLVILCTTFLACSDDNNNNEETNPEELTVDYFDQSAWEGHYIIMANGGEYEAKYDVSFMFTEEDKARATVHQYREYDGELLNVYGSFNYTVNKKKISIGTLGVSNLPLGGDWFATHIEADSLVLDSEPEALLSSETLYLKRTY